MSQIELWVSETSSLLSYRDLWILCKDQFPPMNFRQDSLKRTCKADAALVKVRYPAGNSSAGCSQATTGPRCEGRIGGGGTDKHLRHYLMKRLSGREGFRVTGPHMNAC